MKPLLEHDLIRQTLAATVRPHDAFVDLFAEQTTLTVCQVTTGHGQRSEIHYRQGVGLRRVYEQRQQRLVHSPCLSEAGLQTLVRTLQQDEPSPIILSGGLSVPLETPSLPQIICIAQEAATAAVHGENGRIEAQVTVRHMQQLVQIGRCDGKIKQTARHYTKISIDVTARDDHKVGKVRRQAGAAQPTDLCRDKQHCHLAQQATQAARQQLAAIPMPGGEMCVVFGPGGPATLWHEACGHALEADLAQQPNAAYNGRLGQQVASKDVTLIDDPGAWDQVPIYHQDDEGEDAQPTRLIQNGVLCNYLYDRRTALATGCSSNGHGRRLSYAYSPLPRMSATYLAPGTISASDIIGQTDWGLYVPTIVGGKTDMGSGHFNLRAAECYRIENGHITAPVQGVLLSGYGPEVLGAIDYIGNDFAFLNLAYSCNKLDQFPLIVTVGQPTVRVKKLLVQAI